MPMFEEGDPGWVCGEGAAHRIGRLGHCDAGGCGDGLHAVGSAGGLRACRYCL